MNLSLAPPRAPGNDNCITHWLYDGKANHLPHVSATSYLIGKYVSEYWKCDKNDLDYIDLELTLCGYLDMPTSCPIGRGLKINWIARVLKISPVLLHNDPGLPF